MRIDLSHMHEALWLRPEPELRTLMDILKIKPMLLAPGRLCVASSSLLTSPGRPQAASPRGSGLMHQERVHGCSTPPRMLPETLSESARCVKDKLLSHSSASLPDTTHRVMLPVPHPRQKVNLAIILSKQQRSVSKLVALRLSIFNLNVVADAQKTSLQ